jgi:hypothetical protein
LAKFLEDLTDHYKGSHSVIAVDENAAEVEDRVYPDKVIYRLNQTNRDGYFTVADIANTEAFDVVNIQHEYGLFSGMIGEYVIGLMAAIRKPVVTTFHTYVLRDYGPIDVCVDFLPIESFQNRALSI